MATQSAINLRNDTVRYITRNANFNAFVTLTLKQVMIDDTSSGRIVPIRREDCVRTAWLFRDRLTQRLLRTGRRRAGHRVPIAAFVEGGDVKRFHLHFLVE